MSEIATTRNFQQRHRDPAEDGCGSWDGCGDVACYGCFPARCRGCGVGLSGVEETCCYLCAPYRCEDCGEETIKARTKCAPCAAIIESGLL